MNMFATLLFKQPIRLPAGRARFISADGHQHRTEQTESQAKANAKNEATRLRNIDSVYSAIADGANTIYKISDVAELSVSTVKKAIVELEDNGMITRDASNSQHRFAPKDKS